MLAQTPQTADLAIAPVRDRTAGINGEFLKIRRQSESFCRLLGAYTKANSAFAKQSRNNSKSIGAHHSFYISGPLQPEIDLDQGLIRPSCCPARATATCRHERRKSLTAAAATALD
jgi:hypothetical protein